MLQNARGTAFTVSELLRENQQEVILPPTHPPRLGLNQKHDRPLDTDSKHFQMIPNNLVSNPLKMESSCRPNILVSTKLVIWIK